MRQNERYAGATARPRVDEVDRHATDVGAKVRERVQLSLSCGPVERPGPVRKQILQIREIGPLLPRSARGRVWPTRPSDSRPEICEDLFVNPDRIRLDAHDVPRRTRPRLLSWPATWAPMLAPAGAAVRRYEYLQIVESFRGGRAP